MPRRLRVKFPPIRTLLAGVGQYVLTGKAAILGKGGTTVAPYIVTQPQAISVTAPNPATFSVFAGGTAPLSYQWQRNGVNIAGATSASYTLSPTATTDTGATFRCVVSNGILPNATSISVALTVTLGTAQVWADRIADPGVVWYHNFDKRAEVDQFRFASGYGSGNDPTAAAHDAETVLSWQSAGGADGGGYMRLYRPAGSGLYDSYYWCRQFSPLTGASNGRGVNDPGANGTIPLQTFTPTPQGSETFDWTRVKSRPGYYGKPEYQAAGDYLSPQFPQYASTFDGSDFYVQLRVKTEARRMTVGNLNTYGGKLVNFCTTWGSHPNQEINTVSAWPTPTSPVGGPYQANIHMMYEGAYYGYFDNGDVAHGTVRNSTSPQWAYSGGWDTLLYHITPGTANPALGPYTYDTRVEVWAAHEGDTSYEKIWDVNYRAIFDNPEQYDRYRKFAWNAMLCWIYQNWETTVTDFYQSYDQIIFSRAPIAVPAPSGALAVDTYNFNLGSDYLANSGGPIYWTSIKATWDGKLIAFGSGQHLSSPWPPANPNPYFDNAIRIFDPLTGTAGAYPVTGGAITNLYDSNNSLYDCTQEDNQTWFYIPKADVMVQTPFGFYSRNAAKNGNPESGGTTTNPGGSAANGFNTGTWLAGNMPPRPGYSSTHTMEVIGTGANALWYQDASVTKSDAQSLYNPHQTWSAELDCGFMLGGGRGSYGGVLPEAYFIVPSNSAINPTAVAQGNRYTIYKRTIPSTVGGVTAHRSRARDACCVLGDYVYWAGGGDPTGDVQGASPYFFRMKITPHLTSTGAVMTVGGNAEIIRMPDAPTSFRFGLLMPDKYNNALLLVCEGGIYAFDVTRANVGNNDGTGSGWTAELGAGVGYTSALFNGKGLPFGCMGDFVDATRDTAGNWMNKRAFYWRGGRNGDFWQAGNPANWQTYMTLKLKRT